MAGKPTDVIEDWTYGPVRWIGAGLVIGAATVGAAWSVSARRIPVPPSSVTPAPKLDSAVPQVTQRSVPTAPPEIAPGQRSIVTELPPRETKAPEVVIPVEAKAAAPAAPEGPININTATVEQLEKLPGIGPALAARIIEDRTKNGRYRKIQDLDRVRGIGPKLIEKVRPLVVFE